MFILVELKKAIRLLADLVQHQLPVNTTPSLSVKINVNNKKQIYLL